MIKFFRKISCSPINIKITFIIALLLAFNFSCRNNLNTTEEVQLVFDSDVKELEMVFPNYFSTQLYERDFAMSPDRNEIIYTLGNYDQSLRILVRLKKENNVWGKKTVLPISGTYNDIEPFYSPDGSKLFFASNRPIYGDSLRSDYNIWASEKVNGEWHSPNALDSTINTKGQEYYPAVTNSGNLYFTATRSEGVGLEDIYLSQFAKDTYQSPKVLDSTINSKSYEFNAYVNPDENLIIYSSYGRADGFGGGDLYYSEKDDQGNWMPAKNLGEPINSDKLDFCPFYDEKQQVLYFSSMRINYPNSINTVEEFIKLSEQPENGMSDIYRISTKELFN